VRKTIYKCPICDERLQLEGKSFVCDKKHNFDIAKEGYVNLLVHKSSKEPGDSKLSVISRKEFLDSGYYDQLSNLINTLIFKFISTKTNSQIAVLDIGCGEGFYLSRLNDELNKNGKKSEADLWGLDISKPAIQHASRRSAEINFCVGNALSLPFQDNSVDIALSVFAPLDSEEVNRVLKNDGQLIVVVPGKNHLSGLVKLVYDSSEPHKDDKDPIKGSTKLKLVDTREIKKTITIIGQSKIMSLLLMTPYYWSINLEKKQKLEKLETLETEIDFKVLTYTKGVL